MSIDEGTVKKMLPCYVCGDLPPHLAEQVRAAVERDVELQGLVSSLSTSREACTEALRRAADDVPDVQALVGASRASPILERGDSDSSGQRPRRGSVRWWGLAAGIAAAVLLAIGVGSLGDGDPVTLALVEAHRAAVEHGADFVAERDPAALTAALEGRGALPELAQVADLSGMGLELIGGMVAPGRRLGTVIVYDMDGTAVVCQMYTDLPIHTEAVETLAVAGVELRAFEDGEMSVVEWEMGGIICVYTSKMAIEDLVAVAKTRVTYSPAG